MHLLDVNVWIALAFQRHVHHASAVVWFQTALAPRCFCRFTQAGFLRLATNPAAMGPAAVTMAEAWRAYDIFLADPNVMFVNERKVLKPSGEPIRKVRFSLRRFGRTPIWRHLPNSPHWKLSRSTGDLRNIQRSVRRFCRDAGCASGRSARSCYIFISIAAATLRHSRIMSANCVGVIDW
jgi:hypothetical protein